MPPTHPQRNSSLPEGCPCCFPGKKSVPDRSLLRNVDLQRESPENAFAYTCSNGKSCWLVRALQTNYLHAYEDHHSGDYPVYDNADHFCFLLHCGERSMCSLQRVSHRTSHLLRFQRAASRRSRREECCSPCSCAYPKETNEVASSCDHYQYSHC